MRYAIVTERAEHNYSAHCPDVPGCIATGSTIEETLQQMQKALSLHLEGMIDDGDAVPQPATHVACVEVKVPEPFVVITGR